METEVFKCKYCGASLDLDEFENGVAKCPYCKSEFTFAKRDLPPEVETQIGLGNAELAAGTFDRAYTAFSRAADMAKEESEAYFGMALAAFKVQYLKDTVNERLQAICHEIGEKKFTDDQNFKKAMAFATAAQREVYAKRGKEIDDIREKFLDLERSGLNYDSFICVKVSKDGGGHTEDRFAAERIYRTLKESGYKPFFSEEEIGTRTGADYEAMILYALHKAKSMIIVCFDEEYLKTKWVKNEYTRYIAMQSAGLKEKDSMAIVFKGAPIERLSGLRGKLQGIDFKDAFASKAVTDFVARHANDGKKRANKKAPAIIAAALAGVLAIGAGAFFLIPKDVTPPNGPSAEQPSGGEAGEVSLNYELGADGYRLVKAEVNGNTSLVIPATYEGLAVTEIAASAFQDCAALTELSLPTGVKIENGALTGLNQLKTLTLSFGTHGALGEIFDTQYYAESSLVLQKTGNYYIPNSLESVTVTGNELPVGAFVGCERIKTVVLSDSIAAIPQESFKDCSALSTVNIPSGAVSIGDKAFEGCTSLKEIAASATTTTIGNNAFEDCSALENVTFAGSAENIGTSVFAGCTSLKKATLSLKNKTLAEYFGTQTAVGLTGVTIASGTYYLPNGLTEISIVGDSMKEGAAENCALLEKITLPEDLAEIPAAAFKGCSAVAEFSIPQTVTTIGSGAFEGCSVVQTFDVPVGVTSLGDGVFKNCVALQTLKFPFTAEMTSLGVLFGEAAMARNGNADYVNAAQGEKIYALPAALKTVEARGNILPVGAFKNCSAIEKITLSQNILTIGESTFENCLALTEVSYGNITAIGGAAFKGCSALEKINMPESLLSVGEAAFANCEALARVDGSTIENWSLISFADKTANPVYYANNLYLDGVLLENADLTNVESVSAYAFVKLQSLTSVKTGATTARFGTDAFLDCENLTKTEISSITDWCKIDFESGAANPLCYSGALYVGDTEVTELAFDSSVTEIKNFAFISADNLTKITLHSAIASIGKSAFVGTEKVTEVVFDAENCADLATDSYAFVGVGVQNGFTLTIGEGVQKIPANLFSGSTYVNAINFNAVNCGDLPADNYAFSRAGVSGAGIAMTIGEGVERVPAYFFSPQTNGAGMPKLTSLTVASMVESIGEAAFYNARSLKTLVFNAENCADLTSTDNAFAKIGAAGDGVSVSFGENVKHIPAYLFFDGSQILETSGKITDITFPTGAFSIGAYAFRNALQLSSLTIPDAVTDIGEEAFKGATGLKQVTMPYASEVKFAALFYVTGAASGLDKVTITGGVLPAYAFSDCSKIKDLVIGEGVTEIGDYAFAGMLQLTEFTIAPTVTKMGYALFNGCGNLKKLTIPFLDKRFAATAGAQAKNTLFGEETQALTEVVVTGGESLPASAFFQMRWLEKVTIPETIERLEHLSEGELTSYPYKTYYNYGTFSNCNRLKEVYWNAENCEDFTIYNWIFAHAGESNDTGLKIFIGKNVKRIPTYFLSSVAYYCCEDYLQDGYNPEVTEVTFEADSACESIGEEAFANLPYLTKINMPAALKRIENMAFYNTGSISELHLQDLTNWLAVEVASSPIRSSTSCYVDGELLTELEIPEGVTTLGKVFSNYKKFTRVKIPSTLTSIANNAFYYCDYLEKVEVDSLETWLSINFANVEAQPLRKNAELYVNGTKLTRLTVPTGIDNIKNYAFYGYKGLTEVEMQDGVLGVGVGAFGSCTGLTKVTLNEDLVGIASGAFSGCSALTTIGLPTTLKNIEDSAFSYCTLLNNIDLPDGLKTIGSSAFAYSTNLTKIDIPGGVEQIGSNAFSGCTKLSLIGLAEGIDTIGYSAFSYCTSLQTLIIPDSVATIGSYAFRGCTNLLTLTVGKGLTSVNSSAFANCTYLTAINWNAESCEDLTNKTNAFTGAGTLSGSGITFTIGKGVIKVPAYLFYDSSALSNTSATRAYVTNVTIAKDSVLESIGSYAFRYTNISRVDVPDLGLWLSVGFGNTEANPTHAGGTLYVDGATLSKLVIPESMTEIPANCFQNSEEITEVVVHAGVTAIGTSAFQNCPNLEKVTIEDGGELTINEYAFDTCENLQTVDFGGTKIIGNRAFYQCTKLTSVEFGATNEIGAYAFYQTGLTEITLPENVTKVGDSAFYNCKSLAKVTFTNADTTMNEKVFQNCSALTDVTLPANLQALPSQTFDGCTLLSKIELPSGMTTIDNYAFDDCSGLSEIKWSSGLESIGSYAFRNCTGLTGIELPTSVTSIQTSAFQGCTGLTEITLPDGLTSFGSGVFNGCSNLATINAPAYVYGVSGAFQGCWAITNAKIPVGVTAIPSNLFYNCTGLKTVSFEGEPTSIGESAFYNCNALESVEIPSSVQTIGESAFESCTGMKTLTLNEGLIEIGERAFYSCKGLTELTLPNSLTKVSYYAFESCSELTKLTTGTGLKDVYSRAFAFCSKLSEIYWNAIAANETQTSKFNSAAYSVDGGLTLTIGKDVQSIPAYAFCRYSTYDTGYAPKIGKFVLEKGSALESVGNKVFYNCSAISTVEADSIEDWLKIQFSYTSSNPLSGASDFIVGGTSVVTDENGLVIPDGTTEIKSYAFYGFKKLTKVTLPASLTSIDYGVFTDCTGITDVYIEDLQTLLSANSDPTQYGANLYVNGELFTELVVTDEVVETGKYNGFKALKKVRIADTVKTISANAFYGCTNLTEVTFDEGVIEIGEKAFYNCTALKALTLPDSLTTLGNEAFYGCSSLAQTTFGNGLTSIGKNVFYNCSAIKSVYVDDLETWLNIPFPIASSVSSDSSRIPMYYRDGDPTRSGAALYVDGELFTELTVTEETIDERKYAYLKTLKKVTFADTVKTIGVGAFRDCTSLETVVFSSSSVTTIDSSAFANCDSLTEIEIPASVTKIGESAFNDCSKLATVTLNEGLQEIGDKAFYHGTKLSAITIPDSVTKIGELAFYYCSSMTTVVMGSGVTEVGSDAFEECENITRVETKDINRWAEISFYDWNANPLYFTTYKNQLFENGVKVSNVELTTAKRIGDYAFHDFTGLTITLSDTVESIGRYAFSGASLRSIVIPSSVKTIDDGAFSGCTGLSSVTLNEGLQKIGGFAFNDCSSLKEIILPASVESIGANAFQRAGVTSVTFTGADSWTVVTSAGSSSVVSGTTLADPATAANYLKSTYKSYTWTKMKETV